MERGELDVLRGIADADWPKLHALAVEVHDLHGRLAAVLNLLRSKGFTTTTDRQPHFPGGTVHMVHATRG